VRGGDGSWRGYELMQELLQVPRVVPRALEATGLVAAARRGPLSAALGPGERIALVPEPGHPNLRAVHLGHHHGLDGTLLALNRAGAEIFGVTSGIGYIMNYSREILATQMVFVWALVMVVVMMAADKLIFDAVSRRIERWR